MATTLPKDSFADERLEQILNERVLKLGYRTDAPPFSFRDGKKARGFSVELCVAIGQFINDQLGLADFSAKLVPVDTGDRFDALERGDIDLLCGATTASIQRRESVSFSIPTFSTGVGAVVSNRASDLLVEVLITNRAAAFSEAAITTALQGKTLAVRRNTTAADWLTITKIEELTGKPILPIDDHATGINMVATGALDVYFADTAILIGSVIQMGLQDQVLVSQRTFTKEPYAIALPKGDEALRLAVDTALTRIYRSGKILDIFSHFFGPPNSEVRLFYGAVALHE